MTDLQFISQRARALMASGIVWDNHACMPLRADASFLPQLERYRDAGVTVVSVNIGFADMPWAEHVRVLSFMRRWIAMRPEKYRLLSNVAAVRQCKSDGILGIVFDVEGMSPVQKDISLVQTFYELGVRWMLIAYNRNNAAGGGCMDVDGGLTPVGREIIDEMERVGMVLCLSHTGGRTAAEAMDYARNPVIFSHSNPHGHTPHSRNVSDALIRSCARSGGVVGLSGIGPYLGSNVRVAEHLLSQLRYVVDLVGADHVGLGLDYVFDLAELDEYVRANPTLFPSGFKQCEGMGMVAPEVLGTLVEALARINFTDEQIQGILGENWLRIAAQVWR